MTKKVKSFQLKVDSSGNLTKFNMAFENLDVWKRSARLSAELYKD